MLLHGYPFFTKSIGLFNKLIGVDNLGSVMTFTQGGSALVILNSEGDRTTPSAFLILQKKLLW